mmetsp:Transcript_25299/g.70745  ORF Transcript_25299/g.70745 Transcript_25299/m.70745 type:complete len:119 (-) Transcript_25299:301-657(-)
MVSLLHENIPTEVDDYHPAFWPGPTFLDQEKTIFRALHGGKIRKGSAFSLINPFSRMWSNAKKADLKAGNMTGDGLTMGGLMVVSSKGVHYQFQEHVFGDRAPMEEVVAAAKAAVGAQ